jgi:hypothetical protein
MVIRNPLLAVCLLGIAFPTAATADGLEGPVGLVIRPAQEEAKVKGCRIATPGHYDVNVGDLIELDYTYPVVPAAIPKKLDHKQTGVGAVAKSPVGFRTVVSPKLLGGGTVAFYFDAKKEGEETVTLIIDGAEYQYTFKVAGK